ncbi:uncharacterized protein LACBIDRAFT_324414 [Laccaria bicolor S238N-H82]|uniref:Predicted protein n=1 Tax=Laccaria bicolor (strain S238N-H82 / ATCC MYA-4686) TaxID=486041 RepID=B0D1R6_LACBS|nr:uncharacterized protein LACBIDRAFT_324414 [Laccaria bicolor S238N-H82]EDR11687.1 predicted protein [Laccaria bicolor S238N-H82]|eukprot:XP_001877584.1 predicted protein [Laccaria bicolor S238N-H82]
MNFLPNAMYGMAMTPGHSGIASAQSQNGNRQVSPLQFNFPPQTPSSDMAMANVNTYKNLSIGQKRPRMDVDPASQEMWQPCHVPLVNVDGSRVTDLSDLLAVVFRRMKKAEAELADQSGVYQQVLAQIDVLEKQIGELGAVKDSEPSGEPTKKQKEPQDRGIRKYTWIQKNAYLYPLLYNRVISHTLVQMETICSTQIVVANELDYMLSEDENSSKIELSIWQEKADCYVRPGQTAVEVHRDTLEEWEADDEAADDQAEEAEAETGA